METILRRAAASPFLRHNLVFVSGSLAVSFLNYLYYPVMGRLLVPADFGEVQAVISFFMQANVFLQVLSLITLGVMKRYAADDAQAAVLAELERVALLVGFGLTGLMVLASSLLRSFLNFGSAVPFALLALAVFIGIPLAFSNAYLQALRRFGTLARTNLLGAGSKLVFSLGLVVIGWRTTGALTGVVLAQLVALGYALRQSMALGRPRLSWRPARPRLALIRPELAYGGLVLVVSLCINVLLGIDTIAAKHYFDADTAGRYAGISTVARIIFFVTGPLAAVLIASVRLGHAADNRALLRRSLALLGLLGGGTMAVFFLLPDLVIRVLVGPRYLTYAGLLPGLSLAVFLLSLGYMLLYYQVALRRGRVAGVAIAGLAAVWGSIAIWHADPAAIVRSLLLGSSLLVVLALAAQILPLNKGSAHA